MMGVGSGCSRSARWVAQARLAAAGEWALNEKGIVERAGLGDAARAFNDPDPAAAIDRVAELLAVEWV